MTAARPDAFKVKIQLPDGTTQIQWERPAPLIEPLKVRILDVLDREGKALVALNTLLIAGDLHAEIVARKVQIRDEAANRLIWNFALAKGAAVALNPIPVADMAGGLAVDVGMIVTLSKLYGIPLTRRTAASLVRDMMLALGAMGLVGVASRLLASGLKSSLAGLTVADRRPGRPADRAGLRRHRPGPGGDRRDDVVCPRPGGQDVPPPGLPVGTARDQDGHPADPRRGQGRLGHRPAARRPQEAPEDLIESLEPDQR